MPFAQVVDAARRELTVVVDGRVDFDAIREHLARERREGALGYRELIDARRAVPVVSAADVRRIVALLRAEDSRVALGPTAVVVSTDLAYGLLRMLALLVEDVAEIRPFRDYAAAAEWLAIVGEGGSGPHPH